MPILRCSKEVYDYVTRKAMETGNPASITLDRWLQRELEDGTEKSKSMEGGTKGGAKKRVRGKTKGSGTEPRKPSERLYTIEELAKG